MTKPPQSATANVRCAIYTRKSTEKGLDQAFNSLDAQRESGEAYVRSQASAGWVCLPDHYDDGGFTGANMERPALRRLMADIDGGKVDAVVVYRVDRLGRSFPDFIRMLEVFEQRKVAFVSVTESFNTASSAGRLMLNMLLSFAQFERESISERTRDKIAAARRRGKWIGGRPILGYDVDPRYHRLVVNPQEANRVRTIFDLYLEHRALLPTVGELARRGWSNKAWATRKGTSAGGNSFDKGTLYCLLTNVAYVGQVRYREEIHPGEHEAIVDRETWQRVQVLLQQNGRNGGADVRNRYGALLKGLLRCKPCGCAMTHTFSVKNKSTRYRYYACVNGQKHGRHACPSQSVPAAEIERMVVHRIKGIGSDPALVAATLREARRQWDDEARRQDGDRASVQRDLKRLHTKLRQLVAGTSDATAIAEGVADLNERIRSAEQRALELEAQAKELSATRLDEHEATQSLALFTPVWQALRPREQARIVQLLVERVDYDGQKGTLAITFNPQGIRDLPDQVAAKETAA